MPIKNVTHSGCDIQIDEDNKQLTISGKPIELIWDHVKGQWSSRHLPYSNYDTILALAKDIAEHSADFVSDSE